MIRAAAGSATRQSTYALIPTSVMFRSGIGVQQLVAHRVEQTAQRRLQRAVHRVFAVVEERVERGATGAGAANDVFDRRPVIAARRELLDRGTHQAAALIGASLLGGEAAIATPAGRHARAGSGVRAWSNHVRPDYRHRWSLVSVHGREIAQHSPTRSPNTCAPATCCTRSSGTHAGLRRLVKSCGSGGDAIPEFTLVMLSLSSLGALFFRGRMLRKVITGYSGDTFPNFTPNPWFAGAYERGEVEVEHWSFLAFTQRLEAAARGLARDRHAFDRRLVDGSERRLRRGRHAVRRRSGCSRRSRPMSRCCTRRSPTARATSRCTRRCSKACGVRWRARRGAIVTVERIVDDLRPWSHLVRIPAPPRPRGRRVPDGRASRRPVHRRPSRRRLRRGLRLLGRRARRDARRARRVRRVDQEVGARHRDAGAVGRAGRRRARRARCARRREPDSWHADAEARTSPISTRPSTVGSAPRCGARAISPTACVATGADAVLAGAGVANLSAWLGVQLARDAGRRRAAHRRDRVVGLRRDAGRSVRAQPSQLPDRDDARATRSTVLGALVGGSGTTTIGCLGGAQIDRFGNINSTHIVPRPFLVGSGGGNDVASTAAENVDRRDAHCAAHGRRVQLHHVARHAACARS